jgi:DNA-binding response OmpR family regulator
MKEYKILIVDDDPEILYYFNVCFVEYSVKTFYNPLEAYQEILKEVFHFILFNIYMPNLDGIELCKRIRKSVLNKDSYIYAFTSETHYKVQALFFDAGLDDLIEKPISPEIIKKKMLAHMRRENKRNILPKLEKRLSEHDNDFFLDGNCLGLTKTERKVLRVLIDNREVPLCSPEISEIVMKSYESFRQDCSTIRTHVKKIRKKFNKVEPNTEFIECISNRGYRLINL